MTISFKDIERLNRIFQKNSWPADEKVIGKNNSMFDEFCSLIDLLNDQQKDLIFVLTENFIRFDLSKLYFLLEKAVEIFMSQYIRSYSSIIVLPVRDLGKLRGHAGSGSSFVYILANALKKVLAGEGVKVRALDREDGIDEARGRTCLIVCVDDFLGTGDTALEFYEKKVKTRLGVDDGVLFLSMVCMSKAIESFTKYNLDIVSPFVVGKGVSDFFEEGFVQTALDTMKSIEDLISIDEMYRLGYGRSEALVSLLTTPDNTFPVYWALKNRKSENWPAPFPRYEEGEI